MKQLDLFRKNIATGSRICITGSFDIKPIDIKNQIKRFGIELDISPTKYTNLVFIGENPKDSILEKLKILKHDGYNIPISKSTKELEKLLETGETTFDLHIIEKDIHIDYEFIFNEFNSIIEMPKKGFIHPLYQKNIFIDNAINYNLWQLLGNVGAYCYNTFDPSDINYIWLSKKTLFNIQNRIKDSTISKIEKTYNLSNAIKFNYKFILEQDVLHFLKRRAIDCNDEVSYKLLSAYNANRF